MKIVIERQDGGVSIMHLAEGADAEAEIEKWKTTNPGQYKSQVAADNLPADRDDRGRWKIVNGKVTKPNTPKVEITAAQRIAVQLVEDPIALATLTAALNRGGKP